MDPGVLASDTSPPHNFQTSPSSPASIRSVHLGSTLLPHLDFPFFFFFLLVCFK